jgi:hypothetical protein
MSVAEAALGINFLFGIFRADSVLVGLSPGGIRQGAAPVGATYPLTIVGFQSGVDVYTTNAKRLLVDALYQVKAVGFQDDPQSVVDLASRIDIALGGNQGLSNISITDGYILSCYREASLFYGDTDAGVQYTHLGGLYRLQIQQR